MKPLDPQVREALIMDRWLAVKVWAMPVLLREGRCTTTLLVETPDIRTGCGLASAILSIQAVVYEIQLLRPLGQMTYVYQVMCEGLKVEEGLFTTEATP